jgi:glycosyltransferase involved in cell wall biosynthesis
VAYRPPVSVVVRSYKRPDPLLALLACLLEQDYPDFEIVVVDQSDDPVLLERVRAIGDPRIVLLSRPPLGAPGARNEGIRHARGEILLLIDDDDLPLSPLWISAHVANYEDPRVQGVAGRCVDGPDKAHERRITPRARRKVMSLTFFKDGKCFSWLGERKEDVDFLFGTNASIRRSLAERIGGWDEVPRILWGEEQSFSLKFQQQRRPGEMFVFDPEPVAWRRTDVPGGCERRKGTGWLKRELSSRLLYFRTVAGFYHPWRYRLLLPVFEVRVLFQTWEWIWDSDNRHMSIGQRLRACAAALAVFPSQVFSTHFRPAGGAIVRVRDLFPGTADGRAGGPARE